MPRRPRAEVEFEALQGSHLVEPAFDAEPIPPPEHLSSDMKNWWQQIGSTYVLENHHWKVLQTCCESWDRVQQARQVLAEEGLTIETGTGSRKAHPCIAVERDARAQFLVSLRQLDLDLEPPRTDKAQWRPPPLRSNRTG
jgi:P27 family predicted phage terminase small subunit